MTNSKLRDLLAEKLVQDASKLKKDEYFLIKTTTIKIEDAERQFHNKLLIYLEILENRIDTLEKDLGLMHKTK